MGFDKESEVSVEDIDITGIGFETASRLVEVPVGDLVCGHDLDAGLLAEPAELIGSALQSDKYDYQVAGSAD
ncbi:hypothetical protein [Nocardia sp. NBC_00511]|uniref:DUF7683 domain-containing protein n=1 Tax=Nocardia sp. NBC_00511 TaxID=2903591 RepID=UPI0030E29827